MSLSTTFSNDLNFYLAPAGHLVILTDASDSAGVLINTAVTPVHASVISRGAVKLLESALFGKNLPKVADLPALKKMAFSDTVNYAGGTAAWLADTEGFIASPMAPQAGPADTKLIVGKVDLAVPGIKALVLTDGALTSRKIGIYELHFWRSAEALTEGSVNIIPAPTSIALSRCGVVNPTILPITGKMYAGSSCGSCGTCGLCGICSICAEINAASGIAAATAAVALAGLASSVAVSVL